MWAIVKDSKLVKLTQGNESITEGEIVHPKSIFRHWTQSQLKAVGVYEFISANAPDNRFENGGGVNYAVDDSAGTVTETIATTDKPLADLKTFYKNDINQRSAKFLVSTDWMIVRKAEDSSKSIASAVTTYRAAVRTKANEICTAIDNCDTLDKLKALFVDEFNEDGSLKTIAKINDFPNDEDVIGYYR